MSDTTPTPEGQEERSERSSQALRVLRERYGQAQYIREIKAHRERTGYDLYTAPGI